MASANEPITTLTKLMARLDSLDAKEVVVYFYGTVSENGVSWCPDCADSKDKILSARDNRRSGLVFIECEVGDRDAWKDPNNEFRKGEFSLNSIPTLIALKLEGGHAKRIIHKFEEDQCLLQSNLSSVFESAY